MADFYLLGNSPVSQMFGCVIQTAHHTIVIDGGTVYDEDQLTAFLEQKANSHVDAWFFTHPHHDHIGSFMNIRKHAPYITVNKVYYHFPDGEVLKSLVRNEEETMVTYGFLEILEHQAAHKLSAHDRFVFDDVTIRVLRVFNPEITQNFINNSSAVFRVEGRKASILILGDLGVEGGNELMHSCPLPLLQTDYTQLSHHGQDGVSKEFYNYIKPQRCIWPTPEWLWNNDLGEGYDTGPFKTLHTRQWMSELGVTEHIIEKDGTQKFEF